MKSVHKAFWLALTSVIATSAGTTLLTAQEDRPMPSRAVTRGVPPNVQPGQPVPGQPMPGQPTVPGAAPGAAPMPGVPVVPVLRSTKPEFVADPSELLVKPNPNGMLKINFRGQPWPMVLDWYSRTAGVSLDWQELPGDYLNLTTQKEYPVEEIRDLINRHLLSRGFTLLRREELLTVENIKKLDPSLVPRVRPSELAKLPSHEFVKTSFQLKWLLADEQVEELKPMLSPNGKLSSLRATNRIEAMDAVINLREMWELLEEEQTPKSVTDNLVRSFPLTHVRVEDIIDQVKELMGQRPTSRPSSGGGGGDPYAMQMMQQQMQQQMQQMQQQMQQQQGGKGAVRKEPEVRIVSIPRENSLLVDAPPDKMAKVEQAIEILDQPRLQEGSPFDAIEQTQIYRLNNLNPKSFVETLNRVGGLSPRTTVQVDDPNRAVVVSGSRADQVIVDMLVKKLDGNARSFQVVSLRKLQADYVAGSIRFMMGKEVEESKSSTSRRSYFFDPYGGFGGRGSSGEEKKPDEFRVDADVDNNRLLLWCNDTEKRDIEELLMKLGEITMPGGNMNRRRVFEADSVEDALQLLERLQKTWPQRGKNPLKIDAPAATSEAPEKIPPAGSPDKLKVAPDKKPRSEDREASLDQPLPRTSKTGMVRFASQETEAPQAEQSKPVGNQPSDDEVRKLVEKLRAQQSVRGKQNADLPIHIRIDTDGRLLIECDDPAALDLLEETLDEIAPKQKDWKVFELKYPTTWAYGIELTLKDLFKEEMDTGKKGSSSGFEYDPYFGMVPSQNKSSGARRLSKRKPLKVISDRDTQTILVQGATSDQLRMIQDVINIYDRAPSTEGRAVRKTEIIQLHFGKARTVAEAVKDVYRDLLSDNDKALQEAKQGGKKDERPAGPSTTYVFGAKDGATADSKEEQPVKFKGLLSIGVDESTNTLIVSATEGLLENVKQIIEALDRAAKPNSTMRVVQLDGRVNPKQLQQRLNSILTPKPTPQAPKNGQQPGQQNGGQPGVQAGVPAGE